MKKYLELIIAFGVVVGIVAGGLNYFASAARVMQIEYRLDQKIINDQIKANQQRIWTLEERYYGRDKPREVREECNRLKAEIRRLEKQLWGGR